MKFADIENIWTVDTAALSNADRGRVYFERAKQVVADALTDPAERENAIDGKRFRRDYLVEKIGSQPAVTTQNPRIKDLLKDTDQRLSEEAGRLENTVRRTPGSQSVEVTELRGTIDTLRRRVEVQAAEIVDLRRKLSEAGWVESELADHGRLPW